MHIVLEVPGSHLFPGSRGRLDIYGRSLPLAEREPCIVSFSDGSIANATLKPQGAAALHLSVDPYTTARRTRIPAKTWTLEITEQDDGSVAFRVKARGPNP